MCLVIWRHVSNFLFQCMPIQFLLTPIRVEMHRMDKNHCWDRTHANYRHSLPQTPFDQKNYVSTVYPNDDSVSPLLLAPFPLKRIPGLRQAPRGTLPASLAETNPHGVRESVSMAPERTVTNPHLLARGAGDHRHL